MRNDRRLDESAIARWAGGTVAGLGGRVVGVGRGAVHNAEALADAVDFGRRLGLMGGSVEPTAVRQIFDFEKGLLGTTFAAAAHPQATFAQAQKSFDAAQRKVNPWGSPRADTFRGEVQRSYDLGKSRGELALDAASMAEGGLAVKGLGKLGAFRRLTVADYAAAGFKPKQIKRMMEPYGGVGHHSISRRATKNLPAWVQDNPLFVVKPSTITTGDFYELHYGVDPKFNNARLPRARGGPRSWSGKNLGARKYGALDRYTFGTPEPLQVAGAVNGFGPVFKNYLPSAEEEDDSNHSYVSNQYTRRHGRD